MVRACTWVKLSKLSSSPVIGKLRTPMLSAMNLGGFLKMDLSRKKRSWSDKSSENGPCSS